jgi:hypothetical protein
MSIKQFNGEWVAQEDRILFRFNTTEGQEFRLWLTRHIVSNLLTGCQTLGVQALEKTHPHEVAQAMQEFQHQSVAQQLNFNATYEPQTELPLGEAPALVTGLRITWQSPQVAVDFETNAGQMVHLHLNEALMHTMVSLLDKLQTHAQWQLQAGATPAAPVATGGPASPLMH